MTQLQIQSHTCKAKIQEVKFTEALKTKLKFDFFHFLLNENDDWRKILSGIVGKPGDIIKNAEAAEKKDD